MLEKANITMSWSNILYDTNVGGGSQRADILLVVISRYYRERRQLRPRDTKSCEDIGNFVYQDKVIGDWAPKSLDWLISHEITVLRDNDVVVLSIQSNSTIGLRLANDSSPTAVPHVVGELLATLHRPVKRRLQPCFDVSEMSFPDPQIVVKSFLESLDTLLGFVQGLLSFFVSCLGCIYLLLTCWRGRLIVWCLSPKCCVPDPEARSGSNKLVGLR